MNFEHETKNDKNIMSSSALCIPVACKTTEGENSTVLCYSDMRLSLHLRRSIDPEGGREWCVPATCSP